MAHQSDPTSPTSPPKHCTGEPHELSSLYSCCPMVDPVISSRWLSLLRVPGRRIYRGLSEIMVTIVRVSVSIRGHLLCMAWIPLIRIAATGYWCDCPLSGGRSRTDSQQSVSGTTICIGTGSLIGLAFLTEGKGQIHNEISILASFIGFGFGTGLFRITPVTVLPSLTVESPVDLFRLRALYCRTEFSQATVPGNSVYPRYFAPDGHRLFTYFCLTVLVSWPVPASTDYRRTTGKTLYQPRS
jgi:hypothetical protein